MNCIANLSDSLPRTSKSTAKRRPTHQEKRVIQAKVVKSAFEAEGYQMLSPYVYAKDKLNLLCPNGHRIQVSWNAFQQSSRCAHCAGLVQTHAQVEAALNAEGYKILSEYKNNQTPFDFECPNGHIHSMKWNNFKTGHRCIHCAGMIVTHETVQAAFEAEGYQLLSRYRCNKIKVEFLCPNGHKHSIQWSNFRYGSRCGRCAGKHTTQKEVEDSFKKEGYQLLSTYRRNNRKLEFICPQGHHHSITWAAFKRGRRCGFCASKHITHEEIEAKFTEYGYKLLSTYENSGKRMKMRCPSGHFHLISWDQFKQGHRCGKCFPGGYNPVYPGTLYYVRFDLPDRSSLWKIGITNSTIEQRFASEPLPYEILYKQRYDDGSIPPMLEKQILKKHRASRYKGKALSSGNTECFTQDVLKYDRPLVQLEFLALLSA